MAIKPKCDKCGKELKEFGGILLSPPDKNGKVAKHHLCAMCYREISFGIGKKHKNAMENKIKKTKSAGGVVVNTKEEILVVSQKGTSWSLPKGHIDKGEDAITAAKREIYEESGIIDLELIKELGTYQRYKIGKDGGEDGSELKTIIMFLFKTREYSLKPIDKENPEARWIKKEQVAELLTHPKDKEFFLRISQEI